MVANMHYYSAYFELAGTTLVQAQIIGPGGRQKKTRG